MASTTSASTNLWPVLAPRKRKLSNDSLSGDDENSVIKYYITLEKEDDPVEDTGSESVYTVQDKSTMIISDTTDTDWTDSDIEFDVQSLSEDNPNHPFMFDQDNSSTSEESEAETIQLEDTQLNETEDCAADSSDNDTIPPFSDPEISPADYWNCAQCSAKNNNPLFRYCERCFKVRKEFFPARPKGHKRRHTKNSLSNTKLSESQFSVNDALEEMKESSLSALPSSSQSTITSSQLDSLSECEESDSKVRNYMKQISISTDSGMSDILDCQEENKRCNICLKNPKNAGFFHGGKVHVYCCYLCAKKVWLKFKKCPVCKRKVSCVVRLIFC